MLAIDAQPAVYESAARAAAVQWSGTDKINGRAGWFDSKCPCHEDKSASAGIKWIPGMYGTGWLAFKCHGPCDSKDLEAQAILDGFLPKWEKPKDQGFFYWEEKNLTPIEAYPYRDEAGNTLYEKWRLWDNTANKKTFSQRRRLDGKWKFSLGDVRRVIYKLPETLAAIEKGETIFIMEGEKDCNKAASDGITATCNFEGGDKWSDIYTASLKGAKKVILIPDNDYVGYQHLNRVGESFKKSGQELYYTELAGVETHGDYSDFRAMCGFDLFEIFVEEAVLWTGPIKNPHPRPVQKKAGSEIGESQHQLKIDDIQKDAGSNVYQISRRKTIDIDRVEWWTDSGNAKRFLAKNDDIALYCKQLGWLFRTGTVFSLNNGEVEELAKETARGIVTETDKAESEHLIKFAQKSLEVPGISRMLKSASTLPEIRADIYQFDNDDFILNSPSGVLDLTTGQIMANERKYRCMLIAGCEFNQDAFNAFKDPNDLEALHHYMPMWFSTLGWMTHQFENMELLHYLQEVGGYSLTGSVRQSEAWHLWGEGQNMKSIFLDMLGDCAGSYAKTVPIEMFLISHGPEKQEHNFSQLVNKRICLPGEVPKNAKLNMSKFKTFTGSTDKLPARFLNHEPFDYKNRAKLLMRGNYLPEIRDMDKGIWRRFKKISLKNTIPDNIAIKGFEEHLKEERAAMLAWWIRGAIRQIERGRLVAPSFVEDDVADFKGSMDADQHFIDECLEEDEFGRIPSREMSRVHNEFCREFSFQSCNGINLGFKLKAKGFKKDEKEAKNGRSVYVGWSIKEDWKEARSRYSRPQSY